MSSTASWLTDFTKTTTGFTFNAEKNEGSSEREAVVFVTLNGNSCPLIITQLQDPDKGATSEMGKRISCNTHFINAVVSDTFTQLDDNVGMLQMQFNGQNAGTDYPMAMYLYEVDLSGDVTIAVSCADDDNASIKSSSSSTTVLQTIREQFAAMQSNNSDVIVLGGVNGDFFRTEDNNLIQGVCYRNGVCLKDSFYQEGYNTVFAIKTDGKAMIMNQDQYDSNKSQILEAIGGRQRLVAYGEVYGNDNNDYQPRTAVGVSEDGLKVYLLVIDGRDESWSYGAHYYDLAKIMIAAGAYNAINLDGGGSSVFVQKTSGTGTSDSHYSILNQPIDTDGKSVEREVPNGLAIIKK